MYVKELQARYRLRRIPSMRLPVYRLAMPVDAARIFASLFRHEVIEVSGVICVSAALQVLCYHEISRGTLDEAMMRPRDVL